MHWPAHRRESRAWSPRHRQGSRADRTLEHVEVSIPPLIADLDYETSGTGARAHEDAIIAVARLEAGFGEHLAPLSDFLLRSESVASSKIEHIDAGWRAFGKAFAGGKATGEAKSQLAAVKALTRWSSPPAVGLSASTPCSPRTVSSMAPDFYSARDSGSVRDVQNWIGGSDYTPIDALFVPPPPELVTESDRRPDRVRQPHRPADPRAGSDRARPVRVDPPVHRRQRANRPRTDQLDSAAPRPHPPRDRATGLRDARRHRPLLRRS